MRSLRLGRVRRALARREPVPKGSTPVSKVCMIAGCEMRAWLDARYGAQGRPDARTTRARQRGEAHHLQAHARAVRAGASTNQAPAHLGPAGRCFIAGALYPENAWQVHALRRLREERLRPTAPGRRRSRSMSGSPRP